MVGELWRGAKVLLRRLASQQILFLLYTLCTIAPLPLAKPMVIAQLSCIAARLFDFLRAKYAGRIWRSAEAMARWQAAQVSAIITLHRYLPRCFQIFYLAVRPISSPDRC